MAIEGMPNRCDDQTIRLAEYFGKNRTVKALHVPGTDTDVYAVTSRDGKSTYVAQIYDGFCRVDPKLDHGRLVREYMADTRSWREMAISEPNPLGQEITYGSRRWKIEYGVIPKDKYLDINGTPCLITKRYFEDRNLRELGDDAHRQGHNGSKDAYHQIEDRAREWFTYMNQRTECAYDFAPMNARLVWDKQSMTVRVLLTDLADSLYSAMTKKHRFDPVKLHKPSPTPERGNH